MRIRELKGYILSAYKEDPSWLTLKHEPTKWRLEGDYALQHMLEVFKYRLADEVRDTEGFDSLLREFSGRWRALCTQVNKTISATNHSLPHSAFEDLINKHIKLR